MSLYRGPMIAAALLVVGALAWAASERRAAEDRHLQQLNRQTVALASSVSFLARSCGNGSASPAALAEAFRQRLVLRPPFRFAVVESAGWPVASLGAVPPPDAPEDPTLLVIRTPVGAGAADPYVAGELPWEWRLDRAEAHPVPTWLDSSGQPDRSDLVLAVGLERRPPREVVAHDLVALAVDLGLALLGIAALVFTWARNIRARVVEAELESERRQRAHLEEMSLAAAGLAHETKNPLGIILGLAERISRDSGAAIESRKMAEQIVDAADHAAERLGEFIGFARLGAPKLAPVASLALAEHLQAALGPELEDAGVALRLDVDDLWVELDPSMMQQVLVNLLLNSLQASEKGGEVVLSVKRHDDRAELSVADRGRGIPAELLPRIYQPYVTGRAEGHGLGLAIVKRIADQHGWTIETTSEPGRGTKTVLGGLRVVAPPTRTGVAS